MEIHDPDRICSRPTVAKPSKATCLVIHFGDVRTSPVFPSIKRPSTQPCWSDEMSFWDEASGTVEDIPHTADLTVLHPDCGRLHLLSNQNIIYHHSTGDITPGCPAVDCQQFCRGECCRGKSQLQMSTLA